MATAPALCCPPPGPGLHPRAIPSTREPCDLIPRVHWDECTQEFHAEQITRVVEATNAVEAAVEEQRDVERIILYEGSTPFIRTTVYDPAGALVSTTDTNLNGTPYTVVSPSAVNSVPASQFVDVLRGLGVARSIPTTTVSARVQLTSTTKAVSIEAVDGPVRFAIGDLTVVADAATSHYLGQGSIKDFAVPAGSWIAAIEATGSSATSLEISELV
jgi:hypothetical protein